MIQFFLSSWRSGFRGRTFIGIFLLGVALVGVAYLSSSFSPRQPQTVAMDVGFSGLRMALALFAIVLVQELVCREIDRRAVVLTLAYPASRTAYLFGRYVGIIALVAVATLVLSLLLFIVVLNSSPGYEQSFPILLGWAFWATIFGIWIDVAVVAAFTLLISSLSTVAMLPLMLGSLFAMFTRAIGAVFDYVSHGADGQDALVTQVGPALEVIRMLVPDLSRLDWRVWPMYGVVPDVQGIVLSLLMSMLYIGLMLSLASHVFAKRDFS